MLDLSIARLQQGITFWQERTGWPKDFEAAFYARLSEGRSEGLTERWWLAIVDDLSRWRAIRPLRKSDIHERGLKVLLELDAAYMQLQPLAHSFGAVPWTSVEDLFMIASSIKPLGQSVFPSKLCHFIYPDLFVVVDQMAMGITAPYEVFWESCSSAWVGAGKLRDELIAVLASAMGAIPEGFPLATKITELCAIGTRHGQQTV